MTEKILLVPQADGHTTKLYGFLSDTTSIASVLVLHGMAEHHERYLPFAAALNDAGIDVWLYDHRGHGKDTPQQDLGYLAPTCGYQKLIDDAQQVLDFLREEGRTPKLFLFGHSMGSLVARCLLQQDDKMTGAIICGTTWPDALTTKAGLGLSSLIVRIKGARHRSKLMDRILFKNTQYTRLSTRTDFDWLTRRESIVDDYIADPYCGFLCTASFYHDLIKLTHIAGDKERMQQTRRDLPICLVAGAKDPVGGYGKQVQVLEMFYRIRKYADIQCKLYPEDRHEILNELDRDDVIRDLIQWILCK